MARPVLGRPGGSESTWRHERGAVGRSRAGGDPRPVGYRAAMASVTAAGWIDISATLRDGMPHWPTDPPVVLERAMDIGRGDACNVSRLAMGVHSGTHMDGPVHFLHGAPGLDEMPLSATMGEARVIEIADPRQITADELRGHVLARG